MISLNESLHEKYKSMKESSQNDFKEAVHHFMMAANKGHFDSLINYIELVVESMYQNGVVSIKDLTFCWSQRSSQIL